MVLAIGNCPQCGGPVDLSLGESLLKCVFCKTTLYLKPPQGIFSYFLTISPKVKPKGQNLVYIPYWRLKGIYYRILLQGGLNLTTIDSTVCALKNLQFLPSLGLATILAPLKLNMISPVFLSNTLSPEKAFLIANKKIEIAIGSRSIATGIIGLSKQIIYAPFEMESLSGKVLLKSLWTSNVHTISIRLDEKNGYNILKEISEIKKGYKKQQHNSIKFLSLLCPECGHDLPAVKEACCLFCQHCLRLWELTASGFLPKKAKILTRHRFLREQIFLPFWIISLKVDNFPLKNRFEFLSRLLPYKKFSKTLLKAPLTFPIPAFKINPNLFLKLSRRLCLSPIDFNAAISYGHTIKSSYAINIDFSSASKALSLVLLSLFHNKKPLLKDLNHAKLKITNAELLFLPFKEEGGYLIEANTGLAISSRAISYYNKT